MDSIAAHADLPVEVIYVDNASTDDTLQWLAATWPSVRVVALGRNRFGIAREHGLRLVRGRLTMFLDSDAQLTHGALPRMVEALDQNPGWGMVGPKLVYDDGDLQLSCRRYPPVALPFLRRPPLDRWFDDGRTVRHHLMADDDHAHARPVLYVISAASSSARSSRARPGRSTSTRSPGAGRTPTGACGSATPAARSSTCRPRP